MACQTKPILTNTILRETGRHYGEQQIGDNLQRTEIRYDARTRIRKIVSF